MGVRDNNEQMVMNSANRKPVIMATTVAAMLLVLSGGGYRVLAWCLGATDGGISLPPGALQRLPMKIGDWLGEDVKLDKNIVKMADTDAHVNRGYLRSNGYEGLSLYIAYGVRIRDLKPHRPEVCYTLNGWTRKGKRRVNLPLADGTELRCQILDFSRAGLSTTVLNYYIVDGTYCADVSEVPLGLWSRPDYMAQVLITCSGRGQLSPESSGKTVSAFAVDSTQAIYDLFPNSEDDLKAIWALHDKVMAEYKDADPQGHAKLMELHVPEHEAKFRAKIGKMMGERTGLPAQSTTLPAPVSPSAALSGGRDNG